MRQIDTSYYQSADGQNVKRILVDSYASLIGDLLAEHSAQRVIEMGYGDGDIVALLRSHDLDVVVLEGDTGLCAEGKKRYGADEKVTVVQTLFEAYRTTEPADLVLGNHVLEHVDDPAHVLGQISSWLTPGGRTLLSVPNATSIHRRIGVEMGLLGEVHELNEQDVRVGHQRVYDRESFQNEIEASELRIERLGGFNLKMVSQGQMADWSNDLLRAIYRVSLSCPPEICSNLYAICRKSA
ncbi:class I SAM-dependent methyltransferase [Candidatus Berkelbacteria bacterium]|nr:class I SAM-dependent methyltransferase [Candidatus Berkelbacteria bacterium]